MFLMAPISGILSRKMDPRVMMMIGFLGFAAGTWRMTNLTADWDFYELLIPQILRGVSLMLCMVPINNLALGTLPHDKLKNASGLFNLTRNLGGAVGLAVINTVLTDRNYLPLRAAGRACAAGATRKPRSSSHNMTHNFAVARHGRRHGGHLQAQRAWCISRHG